MRNAKIISYKVKGSFQHNCSMFGKRKIFCMLFARVSLTALRSRWYCVLLKQKQNSYFISRQSFYSHYVSPGWRIFKKWWKTSRLCVFFSPSRHLCSLFLFICERLFCFLCSFCLVIIERHEKKVPNDDSIQISNLWVFATTAACRCASLCVVCIFLHSTAFWCLSTKKNAQP